MFEDKINEINKLMDDFERAKFDYACANFYDDNASWRSARVDGQTRMNVANVKLIELTGKGYNELLEILGSIDTCEESPSLKVGDIVNYHNILFKISQVNKNETKTRKLFHVWYSYEGNEIDGCKWELFTDDKKDWRLATSDEIKAHNDYIKALEDAVANAPYKIGDKFVHKDNAFKGKEFILYEITAKGDIENPYYVYRIKNDELKRQYCMISSFEDDMNKWIKVEK